MVLYMGDFHFVEPLIIVACLVHHTNVVTGFGMMDMKLDRFSKRARFLAGWSIALGSALAVGSVIYQQLQAPLDTSQQTIITSSTKFVVILIPGFPFESILLGLFVGMLALLVVRRRVGRKLG
jgi:hypothetical protein